MRRCPKCRTWKPDANFERLLLGNKLGRHRDKENPWYTECTQCRNTAFHPIATVPKIPGPERLPEECFGGPERELFRKELLAFKRRGAPEIIRKYTTKVWYERGIPTAG